MLVNAENGFLGNQYKEKRMIHVNEYSWMALQMLIFLDALKDLGEMRGIGI